MKRSASSVLGPVPKRTDTGEALNVQQAQFVQQVKEMRNVFLTGGAGTGKSFVLKRALEVGTPGLFVTAMTGTAATLLEMDATTLHSFLGLGPINIPKRAFDLHEEVRKFLSDSERNRYAVQRIRMAKQLVVDEVSMMSAGMFQLVNHILCAVRKSPAPFGGLQLILVGDFMQLDPVVKDATDTKQTSLLNADEALQRDLDCDYAFETELFKSMQLDVSHLTIPMRHADDLEFYALCSRVRFGEHTKEDVELLNSRVMAPPENTPTVYSHLHAVAEHNKREMAKLPGTPRTFKCDIEVHNCLPNGATVKAKSHSVSAATVKLLSDQLIKSGAFDENLELKVGACVMHRKNIKAEGLCNGTLGVITGFSGSGDPIFEYEFRGEKIKKILKKENWTRSVTAKQCVAVRQYPVVVAFALTVHKVQGSTLDRMYVDLSRTFANGQVYTAITRVRSLNGLFFSAPFPPHFRVSEKAAAFYAKLEGGPLS